LAEYIACQQAEDEHAVFGPLDDEIRSEILDFAKGTYAEPYIVFLQLDMPGFTPDVTTGMTAFHKGKRLIDRMVDFFRTSRCGVIDPAPAEDELRQVFDCEAELVAAMWPAVRFIDAVRVVEHVEGLCERSFMFRNKAWAMFRALRPDVLLASANDTAEHAREWKTFECALRAVAKKTRESIEDEQQNLVATTLDRKQDILRAYVPSETGIPAQYVAKVFANDRKTKLRKRGLTSVTVRVSEDHGIEPDYNEEGQSEPCNGLVARQRPVREGWRIAEVARQLDFAETTVRNALNDAIELAGCAPERDGSGYLLDADWRVRVREQLKGTSTREAWTCLADFVEEAVADGLLRRDDDVPALLKEAELRLGVRAKRRAGGPVRISESHARTILEIAMLDHGQKKLEMIT
jgi:hypothetical protein